MRNATNPLPSWPLSIAYGDWTLYSKPVFREKKYYVWVAISREGRDLLVADRFVFTDLGCYDWEGFAYDRGLEWARNWIDLNYG